MTHFKILGQDQLGLWVEHPKLTFRYTTSKDGEPLPAEKQKAETVDAVFLIAWGNLDTVMHYPNREGYDFPSEFDTEIGFKRIGEDEQCGMVLLSCGSRRKAGVL